MASFHAFHLWLHILSAAVWIGSMGFFLFVFAPAVHSLRPESGVRLLDRGRQRFETLSWVAIALLLISGVSSFGLRAANADSHLGMAYYSIFGGKLFFFFAMLFHHCLQAFKYGPKIVSLSAEAPQQADAWPEPLLSHWKKWFLLLKINATLGVMLLFLGLALTRI